MGGTVFSRWRRFCRYASRYCFLEVDGSHGLQFNFVHYSFMFAGFVLIETKGASRVLSSISPLSDNTTIYHPVYANSLLAMYARPVYLIVRTLPRKTG